MDDCRDSAPTIIHKLIYGERGNKRVNMANLVASTPQCMILSDRFL
jgi:hypothetical protein